MLESPPSLGLGTIYIAPLCGMTNLTTKAWVQILGMGMGRCQTPNRTQPMGRFPLIVSYVLISFKACSILHPKLTHTHTHTHTHQHSSNNQHGINYPKTLTYIYHGNSPQAQHTFVMHIILSYPRQQINKIPQEQKHRHCSKVLTSNITQTSKHSIKASNKHIHYVHHPKCMFM